jgi:hypothetical protein
MIESIVQLGHGMEWLHSTDPDPSAKGSAKTNSRVQYSRVRFSGSESCLDLVDELAGRISASSLNYPSELQSDNKRGSGNHSPYRFSLTSMAQATKRIIEILH